MSKIKVFISSLCGEEEESFLIIRHAIANELKKTGLVDDVFVFEEESASSSSLEEDIITALIDSDVVLFLIDSRSGVSAGVRREWMYSKEISKKVLCIFYNEPRKNKTDLQKECERLKIRYKRIKCFTEFIEEGCKVVIDDVISVYKKSKTTFSFEEEILVYKSTTSDESETTSIEPVIILDESIVTPDESANVFVEHTVKSKFHDNYGFIVKKKNLNYYEALFDEVGKFIHYPLGKNGKEEKELEPHEELLMNLFKISVSSMRVEELNIPALTNFLKEIHEEKIASIICKRWSAITEYYKGDIFKTLNILQELYKEMDDKNIPEWLIQDILIDLRNIEQEYLLTQNKRVIKSEYQKQLSNDKNVLVYPVGDRLSKNIYKKLVDDYQKVSFQSPNTVVMGVGINIPIQHYIQFLITATIFGSLTHFELTLSLLKDIVVNYLLNYDIGQLKMPAIKLALLAKDFKLFKNLCNKNQGMLNVATETELNEIFAITFENKRSKFEFILILMTHLGYYISDELFEEYYNKIHIQVLSWLSDSKKEIKYGKLIFDMYKGIALRLSVDVLISIAKLTYENGVFRFLDDSLEILHYANFEHSSVSLDRDLTSLLKMLNSNLEHVEKSNQITNISVGLLIAFPSVKEQLKKQIPNWPHINDELISQSYALAYPSKMIKDAILKMNYRLDNQGKNGVYHGYSTSPISKLYSLMDDYKNEYWTVKLVEELVDTMTQFVLNRNQSINEKIETIHFIMKLHDKFIWGKKKKIVETGIEKIISLKEEIEFSRDDFLSNSNNNDIKFNLLLLEVLTSIGGHDKKLLEVYKYIFINDFSDIKIIEALKVFIDCYSGNIGDSEISSLMQIVLSFINHNQIEVRLMAIELLINFNSEIYKEVVESIVLEIFDENDARVKVKVLKLSNKLSEDLRDTLYSKGQLSNHYLIKSYLNELDI